MTAQQRRVATNGVELDVTAAGTPGDPVGAGHWTQQERPAEFNAALLELLSRV